MGFGWLFFGYFTATFLSLNPAGSFICLGGYGIILFSVLRLRKYNRCFDLMLLATVAMMCVSALLAVADAGSYLYEGLIISKPLFSNGMRAVIGYIESAVGLLFNCAMLVAILAIARETEAAKVVSGVIRNAIVLAVYVAVQIICLLPVAAVKSFVEKSGLAMISFVLYIALLILNHVLIFNCYARICDEGDVEMEQKPSRFEFVNKFRAELNEKEERAKSSTEKYLQDRIHKKRRKKK